MPTKKYNQYKGKSGHLFVMSELLWRGWNVGIPEVDVGDDVFVVHDEKGDLLRVQVKTTDAIFYKNKSRGFYSDFTIPRKQLKKPKRNEPIFALVVRKQNYFSDVILIDRIKLEELYDKKNRKPKKTKGRPKKKKTRSRNIGFHLSFNQNNCTYKNDSTIKDYRNNWDRYFKFILQ